jgi:hypothetical protein
MYTAKECAPCKQFKPDYNAVHKKVKQSQLKRQIVQGETC